MWETVTPKPGGKPAGRMRGQRGVIMKLTREQQNELMDCLLDMGQLLLDCGAEISRVEETLCRIGKAYGAAHVEAFVITSIISLSMEFPGEEAVTDTRRIFSSTGTDFYRLEKLNELSRSCCAAPVPLPEFRAAVEQVASGVKPFRIVLAGSVLAAGSFAVFFGGSVWDGLAAAVFGALICLLQLRLDRTEINTVARNLLVSFLVGVAVGLLTAAIPALHMDKILIGDIMLLIPGLAMTNAVRNILLGNTISGLVRLADSLLWAGSLAGGFMVAMRICDILL